MTKEEKEEEEQQAKMPTNETKKRVCKTALMPRVMKKRE